MNFYFFNLTEEAPVYYTVSPDRSGRGIFKIIKKILKFFFANLCSHKNTTSQYQGESVYPDRSAQGIKKYGPSIGSLRNAAQTRPIFHHR